MPSDPLYQLQQCLDQLNTQIYASLRYINTHHPAAALPNHSTTAHPSTNGDTVPPPQLDASDTFPPDHRPESTATFSSHQRELAHDLILKSQQIQTHIQAIPSQRSTEEQEKRIEELEVELQQALQERRQAEVERKEWLDRVDDLIVGVRR